ncbi:hypothetical protein ACFYTC_01460 [Actinomadura nitritigenes]|uniref:hypothetical protein n=1 Tax=Actinomadura nitritigenes TaxID=134602 RepID=UPI0036A983C6
MPDVDAAAASQGGADRRAEFRQVVVTNKDPMPRLGESPLGRTLGRRANGGLRCGTLRAELTAHVTCQIVSYKKPRRLLFRDTMTAVGKLDRKRLRADHADDR